MKKVMIFILLNFSLATPDFSAAVGSGTIDEQFLDAAYNGDVDQVKKLYLDGADLNKASYGNTALHYASFTRSEKVVLFLLLNNASVDIKDSNGRIPLYLAAYAGSYKLVTILLEYKSNPNIQDKDGNTALHAAVLGIISLENDNMLLSEAQFKRESVNKEYNRIVTILLSDGADTCIKNKEDKMPIDLVKDKRSDLFKILQQATSSQAE